MLPPFMLNVPFSFTYTPPPLPVTVLPVMLPPYILNVAFPTYTPPPLKLESLPVMLPPYMVNVPLYTDTPIPGYFMLLLVFFPWVILPLLPLQSQRVKLPDLTSMTLEPSRLARVMLWPFRQRVTSLAGLQGSLILTSCVK